RDQPFPGVPLPAQPRPMTPGLIAPLVTARCSNLLLPGSPPLPCFAQQSRDGPLSATAPRASASRADCSNSRVTGQPLSNQARTTYAVSQLCHHADSAQHFSALPSPTGTRHPRGSTALPLRDTYLARYQHSPGNCSTVVVAAPRRLQALYPI